MTTSPSQNLTLHPSDPPKPMGICQSGDAVSSKNRELVRNQLKQSKASASTVKLLLLGAGDSGKTTIRKQMKHIYGRGFGKTARKQVAPVIISTLIAGARDVLNGMNSLKIDFVDPAKMEVHAQTVRDIKNIQVLTPEGASALNTLYTDAGFKNAYAKRSDFQLQDCWITFMEACAAFPEWGGVSWG